MAVYNGIAVKVQCFDGPHILHFRVQLGYNVVRGIDFSEIGKLFYPS